MAHVDIWSKGEVAGYLANLAKNGQVKECKFLRLEHGHAGAYYPRCEKDWASRVTARNVYTDTTAYSGPSSYSWPACPPDCPHFQQVSDFLVSVSRDQYDKEEIVPVKGPEVSHQTAIVSAKATTRSEPEPPQKVTIPWLLKHVPVKLWLAAAGLLAAAFLAGIKASEVSFVRELMGMDKTKAVPTEVQPAAPKDVGKKKPES